MQNRQVHWSLVLVFGLLIGAPTLKDFVPKFKGGGFVYIPGGDLQRPETEKVSLNAFYMFETEITNAQYKSYLKDLQRQGKTDELAIAAVNSKLWNTLEGSNQPLADNYFDHPAYADYPVVNISYEAAVNYCKWMTQGLNNQLEAEGIQVRLPTRKEWTYAAQGGLNSAPYPWGGYYVKNSKGCYLANFNPQEANNDDGGLYTVLASAYFPNDYGLYNTSGNVAEMLSEEGIAMGGSWKTTSSKEIQVDSESSYVSAAPTLGFRPVMSVETMDLTDKKNRKKLSKAWGKALKEIQTD